MNKIYIGNTEVANVGSGGGGGQEFNPSDYVDTSTWNEHEKVIASALVNLKGLEDQIEAFDADIQAQETALLAEVHVVEQTKADVSVVYTKNDIDKSDKVVAAALASLNERVSTLETSSGGSGGSGDSFDPEYLEVELADVSARVDALEQYDYVVTNDISAFVKENDISTFVTQTALDASYINLRNRYKIYEGVNPRNNNKYLYTYFSKTPGSTSGDKSYVNCPDVNYGVSQNSIETGYGAHVEGLAGSVTGRFSYGFGVVTRSLNFGEFSCGTFNIARGNTPNDVPDSSLVTLFNVGNGINNNRHNALEVRRLGDVYISDVSAAGLYYEKPMINLQQKIYELEARIAALEAGNS